MCRVGGCYRGGIMVMDVIWHRPCVSMILFIFICYELGKGATSKAGKHSLQSC